VLFLTDVSPFGEFSGSAVTPTAISSSSVSSVVAVASATSPSSSSSSASSSSGSSSSSSRKALVTPGVPLPPPPLRFCLVLPKKSFVHDFVQEQLCLVPCSVVIHNATGETVCGLFHAQPPSGVLQRQCYFWVGAVTQKFQVLPRSTVTISLGLGFSSAGVFTIDRFAVNVGDKVMLPSQPEHVEVHNETRV
jgi:hypothetical protein